MSIHPVSVAAFQEEGFPVGAESLVAVDLVDTTLSPELAGTRPPDRFDDPSAFEAWWRLESKRLPEAEKPDLTSVRRLRDALRVLFEAHIDGRELPEWATEEVNAFAASVPISVRLTRGGGREQRWHREHGGHPSLASIATEAIELLADPRRSALLRRCANEECAMVFVAENQRRLWCASNVCGNRARVARHYKRIKNASA